MSTVAFSRLIEAPADELWRVFTDLPARPRWLCQVDEVEVLNPASAPAPGQAAAPSGSGGGSNTSREGSDTDREGSATGLGVGTVWRESRTGPDGTVMVEEFAVQEALPPRRLVVSSSGNGVDYLTTYTFVPVPARRPGRGRTVVTVSHEGVPTARYGRLLAVVFGGLAARAGEGALRRDLADLATATATGPSGPAVAA
ncbi:SRPBCC family protein [Plantactinospora sp. ZYX-F-223]|uniref:SRPBCC family protein n=1 Tax=Plantactinospora sp. ZYX-F-223 TaxID=3144103 RepID=UPI0031FDFEBF